MRKSQYFLISFFLILTACTLQNEYKPKWPPTRVERPAISFDLAPLSDGIMIIRMTNNGEDLFRYYSTFPPHYSYYPKFRLCEGVRAECEEMEWVATNTRVSHADLLPSDFFKLNEGGSTAWVVQTKSMFAAGGVYELKPDQHFQIKFRVMLTPYHEEYIEYVSEWMPVETLTRP